jgi:acyl-coenzyme A thioesterase PaaI-like protein
VKRALRLRPKNARACYVCGPENPGGLHVSFAADGPHGSRALYTARPEHEGWPGLLHGGVTFALMDKALGWAVYFQGLFGVTAKTEARFRQPIPIGMKLVIRAWTVSQRRRIVTARAEIRVDANDEVLVAEADATMYVQDSERFDHD